jgi:hypothetical protein
MIRAATAGIKPQDFWPLSLRELDAALKGASERARANYELAIIEAWHMAAFSRVERMPDLKHVLSPLHHQKKSPKMSPEQQRAKIMMLNDLFGGSVVVEERK